MNRYISVLSKESWIIVADIVAIIFWWYHNPYMLDKIADVFDAIGLPSLFSAILVMAFVVVVPLVLFIVAIRHDAKVDAVPKDEREQQNEFKISENGYFFCISGLTTYLVLAPYQQEMIWLWGVLLLTLGARLWKRFELERD
jgi:hypothetical protein